MLTMTSYLEIEFGAVMAGVCPQQGIHILHGQHHRILQLVIVHVPPQQIGPVQLLKHNTELLNISHKVLLLGLKS